MGRKKVLSKVAFALSAAIVSMASPLWQLSAFADDNILVKMPGASSAQGSAQGTWDLTWTVGNNDVTLSTNTSENVVDDAGAKAISFVSISDVKGGLWFESQGDFCSSYNAKLSVPGGWSRNLTCTYSPQTEYGGNVSQLYFTDDVELPNEASFFILSVEVNAPSFFGVIFDNVESYDEQAGTWVTVGPAPSDTSLSGKHFTITSTGFIGGMGDDSGSIYSFATQDPDEYRNLSLTISGDDFDADTMALVLHGDNNYQQVAECARVGSGCVVSFNQYNLPDQVHVDIMSKDNTGPQPDPDPGPQPHPGDPTDGTITVHSSNGFADPKSFYKSRIAINDTTILDQECELNSSQCPDSFSGNVTYNKEASASTVEISFSPLFINKIVNKIIINNTEYNVPINYSNRVDWLAHYDHQELKFTLDNVPYASSYDITVDITEADRDTEQFIGNFLWSNKEEDKDNDVYIGHARIEMVSLLCHIDEGNDVLITPETENLPAGCVVEFDQGEQEGSLVVPDGSVVTLKLWTEYGWQVVSFGANGQDIAVDPDKIAEYTFTIAKGNYHLGAVVEQTDDEVQADSEKIKSGSITLGGSEIDEGTALLTVGDADLTDEEREEFQKQAGDYKVSSYLEIDLDQIFYDGHGSYWKGAEMKELDNEATITLELEEGIDGNEVIIVHKKHDGTYEVIPTIYDPVAHTITFKTSSFSDYAIASRNVASPKTYDDIMKHVAVFMICFTGGFAIFLGNRFAAAKN